MAEFAALLVVLLFVWLFVFSKQASSLWRRGSLALKGIPLSHDRDTTAPPIDKIKFISIAGDADTIVNALNNRDFDALTPHVRACSDPQDADGIPWAEHVSRRVYRNKRFREWLRTAARAMPDDAVLIAKSVEASKRYYDAYEYDIEYRHHHTYLLANDQYMTFPFKTDYSGMMDRD